jgi:hypothetical protein
MSQSSESNNKHTDGIVDAAIKAGYPESKAYSDFWYNGGSLRPRFVFFCRGNEPTRVFHDGVDPDYNLIYLQLMVLVK